MQSEHFTKFTKMGSSLEHHAVQSVDEASPQPESTESILGAAEFFTSSEVTKTSNCINYVALLPRHNTPSFPLGCKNEWENM